MSRLLHLLVPACVLTATAAFGGDLPRGFPLAAPPLDALADLGKLPGPAAGKPTAEELRLLADGWKRATAKPADRPKADLASTFDAVLFACGVENADARARYRTQFDALVADAEKAVAGASGPADTGERLMRFLHKGVMKNGFDLEQSLLTGVFDTGKFNCVSSTATYYLVGTRLGLELIPQEVPGNGFLAGHAWLEAVIDGKRVEVECTNADGFDFETKLRKPGVIRLGPAIDRSMKRETDGFGVAAMTYANRGTAAKDNRAAAVRAYLSALALDPADRTADNNLRSAFVNWGPEREKAGQYEEAVAVLAHGRRLIPTEDKLRNNQRVVWMNYLDRTLDRGEDAELAGRLARAKTAVGGTGFDSPAEWYSRLAHLRIPKGWDAALAAIDRGLKAVPEREQKVLRRERVSLCRQWSQDRLRAGDADGSLKALTAAGDAAPDALEAGLAYHTQEALRSLSRKGGAEAVTAHHAALRKQFPKSKSVAEVAADHVRRTVSDAARNKSLDDALKAAKELAELLPTAAARADVGGTAYCEAAGKLADGKKWEEALTVFAAGLKEYPKHGRLLNNAVATVDDWARTAMEATDWDEAIRIYEAGLKVLPGDGHLTHNKAYCQSRKAKGGR